MSEPRLRDRRSFLRTVGTGAGVIAGATVGSTVLGPALAQEGDADSGAGFLVYVGDDPDARLLYDFYTQRGWSEVVESSSVRHGIHVPDQPARRYHAIQTVMTEPSNLAFAALVADGPDQPAETFTTPRSDEWANARGVPLGDDSGQLVLRNSYIVRDGRVVPNEAPIFTGPPPA